MQAFGLDVKWESFPAELQTLGWFPQARILEEHLGLYFRYFAFTCRLVPVIMTSIHEGHDLPSSSRTGHEDHRTDH